MWLFHTNFIVYRFGAGNLKKNKINFCEKNRPKRKDRFCNKAGVMPLVGRDLVIGVSKFQSAIGLISIINNCKYTVEGVVSSGLVNGCIALTNSIE